jgi:hypothetical protein
MIAWLNQHWFVEALVTIAMALIVVWILIQVLEFFR